MYCPPSSSDTHLLGALSTVLCLVSVSLQVQGVLSVRGSGWRRRPTAAVRVVTARRQSRSVPAEVSSLSSMAPLTRASLQEKEDGQVKRVWNSRRRNQVICGNQWLLVLLSSLSTMKRHQIPSLLSLYPLPTLHMYSENVKKKHRLKLHCNISHNFEKIILLFRIGPTPSMFRIVESTSETVTDSH